MGEQLRAAAPEVSVPRVPAGAGSRGRGAGGRRFSRGGPGLGRQRAGRGRAAGRDWGLGPEGPPPAGLCPPPRPPGRCASLFIPLFLRIPTASPPPTSPPPPGDVLFMTPPGFVRGAGAFLRSSPSAARPRGWGEGGGRDGRGRGLEAKWLQGGQGFPIRAGSPGFERHLFALGGAGVAAA